MHKMVSFMTGCLFCAQNIYAVKENTIEKKLRWANRAEAKAFAKKAEELGNLGMTYAACCDYLGWDISIRREIMAANKRKAHAREKRWLNDHVNKEDSNEVKSN